MKVKICNVKDCNNKHEAKGYCKKHYRAFRKYGNPLHVSKRASRTTTSSEIRVINNVKFKKCLICEEWIELNEENFYISKSGKDGFHPYCKICAIRKSKKYQDDNKAKVSEYSKQIYKEKEQYYKDKAKRWNNQNTEHSKDLKQKWRRGNKNKLKDYRIKRLFHKSHDISEDEIRLIYSYSNSCCMYCGITEEEAIEKYQNKLHKDHADNFGSDGIENCILACKGCNSSKHDKDWEEWFINSNMYDEERKKAIAYWLDLWK